MNASTCLSLRHWWHFPDICVARDSGVCSLRHLDCHQECVATHIPQYLGCLQLERKPRGGTAFTVQENLTGPYHQLTCFCLISGGVGSAAEQRMLTRTQKWWMSIMNRTWGPRFFVDAAVIKPKGWTNHNIPYRVKTFISNLILKQTGHGTQDLYRERYGDETATSADSLSIAME